MHTQVVVHLRKGAEMNNEQEMEKWFESQPPMLSDIRISTLILGQGNMCTHVHFSIVCMCTPQYT